MSRWLAAAVVLALAGAPIRLEAQQVAQMDDLQAVFSQWAREHRLVGIAAGRIDGNKESVAVAGVRTSGAATPVDSRTVFEIGSITKIFTGTLLADMVLRHEVALDDPVAALLPGWQIPSWHGQQITLLDLATHTSGLPRLPALHPANPDDPYADLTEAQLRDFLAQDTLTRAPGSQYEYSNLGMGLLALALSRHAGVAYETLLEQRILGPLGMHDTRITLTPELEERSATGHDESLEPTHAWHFEMLAGAGALHSTLPDLLKLARAVLDTGHGPLARDLAFAIRTRRPTSATDSIGLAWHHLHVGTTDVVWHNGGTGGFRSWLAIDIAHQRAAVFLANVGGNFPLDPIGLALLRGGDLPPPPVVLSAIALPPEALERFVGIYQLTPSFSIVITRAGDQLEAQATGQQKLPIFPSAPTTFFYKVVKAELLFQLDSSNRVTGVVLRQNGIDQVGRKVR